MNTSRADTAELKELLRSGFVALNAGRLKEAAQCCRAVLERKPDLVQGHFLTGLVALEAKDRKTAFAAFVSVTRLDKRHAAAWAQLAKLFMSDGQVTRADAALREAAAGNPEDPLVQDLLGSVYSMMGDHGLAQEWFTKAVDAQPTHPPYLLNLANNHIYHGNRREAEQLLKQLLERQPRSPQAHWSLAGLRRAGDRQHIEQMQELLTAERNPRARAFYSYAIGKELEDLSSWDDAFDAFAEGAAARRETVAYDEDAEVEMFDYLTEHFTRAWLDAPTGMEPSSAPIFVLGQPRTGTTLVERIIGSHSRVHSAGELQQLGLAIRRVTGHQDPRRFSAAFFAAAKGSELDRVAATYLTSSERMRGSTPHFVDKLPQNYLLIPIIAKALPNAKIVHLTRSPMDACFASFKQLFADAYLHSYDLAEMARHHARYLRLMAHWREQFPGAFYDISYEATVRDLEASARDLLEYLGLPWEDACLRFHEQETTVSTASAVQVREPVHTRSIDRWRRYAEQLEPLRAELEKEGVPI